MAYPNVYSNAGFAGNITQGRDTTVETCALDDGAALGPTAYGVAVKISATTGKVQTIASGDTDAVFAGVLARPQYPCDNDPPAGVLTGPVPNPKELHNLVSEGYINVRCVTGTPVRGQPAFMVTTPVAATDMNAGDFCTDATNGGVALTRVFWAVNGKDANNVTEIVIRG